MSPKETLLYRLTELMFEKQQPFLLLDELYEDVIISPFVRNIQIDSPFQQLVFEGVLSQYNHQNEIVVSFTVEAYFHHLLAKVLQKDERYQTAESLINLIRVNTLVGLKDGISNLLSFDVEIGVSNRLVDFIDICSDVTILEIICLMPFINSIQIKGIEKSFKKLFLKNSKNDWILIQRVSQKLFFLESHNIRNELTEYLINLKIENNENYLEIITAGVSELENKKMLSYLGSLELMNLSFNSKIHFNIANCYEKIYDNEKAMFYYQKSFDLRNLEDLEFESMLYQKIGWVYCNLNDFEKALFFNKKSLKIRKTLFGEIHELVAHSYNDLGLVFDGIGKYYLGIECIKKAILILSKKLGGNIIDIGTSYYNLGNILYYAIRDLDNALLNIKKALTIYNNILGDNHINCSHFNYTAGEIYFDKKEFKKSLLYFNKSLTISIKYFGFEHEETAKVYNEIGKIFLEIKKYKIAIKNFKKGFEIDRSGSYPFNIALCYEAINESENALESFIQSAEIRKQDLEVGLEAELTIESIINAKRLAKQLNKENELPQWIKNIN